MTRRRPPGTAEGPTLDRKQTFLLGLLRLSVVNISLTATNQVIRVASVTQVKRRTSTSLCPKKTATAQQDAVGEQTMPKSNKTKDHKRPRARHRRAPKRAAVVADPRPLNRRVWPSLVAPILDHLLIEHVMYYTCVAKLFNDAVPFLSVVEQRKVAEHAPDRDKARHVLWQPAVWLRLSRARQVTLAIETPEAPPDLKSMLAMISVTWLASLVEN